MTRNLLVMLSVLACCPCLPAQTTRRSDALELEHLKNQMQFQARTNQPPEISRQQFIQVERTIRLPLQDQQKDFDEIYRNCPPLISSVVESLLSSFPGSLLSRQPRPPGVHPDAAEIQRGYMAELDTAAATMSPEQVADQIQSIGLLQIATRRRCIELFLRNRPELIKLLDQDLSGNDEASHQRAYFVIGELKLADYFDAAIQTYLGNGPFADDAYIALSGLRDPQYARPLLDDIERDPSAVRRHQYLLRTMLWRQPADSTLLKLLDSADPKIRNAAATALDGAEGKSYVERIPQLIADPDPDVRIRGLQSAFALSDDLYATVRPSVMNCLKDSQIEVRIEAAYGLGRKKDLSAAPVLLELLKNPDVPLNMRGRVGTAVSQMMNARPPARFDTREWGGDNATNAQLISRFEQWIAANAAPPK